MHTDLGTRAEDKFVSQHIADSLDEGASISAILNYFSKACDLVPYDWLLTKTVAFGVDSRVDVWFR